ncbi:hypothetical protein CROQUDRAFT_683558 [Cronartium quercuum f. sp. fusiforme G11]|uniref:Uncharacterized protein n=1 Tax=Cronartium quercuum f. sp. fusiforme G11 TaxID=708437 RepID=A0A9P6N8M1_9BASI|nr:hypothetical protein CROQUDRAFT_683558 [Cronartium quercuum f. sp. fusiforme G11]
MYSLISFEGSQAMLATSIGKNLLWVLMDLRTSLILVVSSGAKSMSKAMKPGGV